MRIAAAIVLLGLMALGLCGQTTSQSIYADALQGGWQNYGWAQLDYAATSFVHGGTKSISVTIAQAYQAIYLHHTAQDASPFTNTEGGGGGGPVSARSSR